MEDNVQVGRDGNKSSKEQKNSRQIRCIHIIKHEQNTHVEKDITKASLRAEMGEIRRLREEMVSIISFT